MSAVTPGQADGSGQGLPVAGQYGTSVASGGATARAEASDAMCGRMGEPWNDYGVLGTSPDQYPGGRHYS